MHKEYQLGQLMQELSNFYEIKLKDSTRGELLREPYLELSEKITLECESRERSMIIQKGIRAGVKLIYFGVMQGDYELNDIVKQTSVMKYSPFEFGAVINLEKAVKLVRYNSQLDLKIMDREIERSLQNINGFNSIVTSFHNDCCSSEFKNLKQKLDFSKKLITDLIR